MRRFFVIVVAVLVVGASAASVLSGVPTPPPLERPDTQGDQLIFYYDARASFNSFLAIRNTGLSELTISVLFYGPTFSTPFSQALTLGAGTLEIIDVGALRASGLPAQSGAAFATAVNIGGQPIVTGALSGNFTIANLATGSAWGSPAAARSAREGGSGIPALGSPIDGSSVALQPIRPIALELAAYYNPNNLAPVVNGGNQLIFITFEDDPGPTFSAAIGSTTWDVTAVRSNGTPISNNEFTANGVTVSDLASVAGAGVNGASGSMLFLATVGTHGLNRMIFFAEALGTFGTGYMLPPAPILL